MSNGHRQAQALFEALGRRFGYRAEKTFSRRYPTDGVWFADPPSSRFAAFPVAAIEVVVSESTKTIRGSVATLELVSPALGVVLIHEEELGRRLALRDATSAANLAHISRIQERVLQHSETSRQRIEVWSFAQLLRRYRLATGNRNDGLTAVA